MEYALFFSTLHDPEALKVTIAVISATSVSAARKCIEVRVDVTYWIPEE